MYLGIEEELVQQVGAWRANRQEAMKRLYEARGAQGLQAKGALMSIFSTEAAVFRDFLAACPEYVNMSTFSSSPSNAISGSAMLFQATELQALVGASGAAPNTTLLGEPLANLMRLKALWGSRLLSVTLLIADHPALGRMVVVQPLLLAACMQRVHNYGHEVDPVFTVLLEAGADPNARNSLNMTPLMLVAAALINDLESRADMLGARGEGGDDGGGGVGALRRLLVERVPTATATARLLLRAGADPAAPMLGFGAVWREKDRRFSLPAQMGSARHVLHMERYTAFEGFQLMRTALMADWPGPIPDDPLDEFAELLRPVGQQPAGEGPAGRDVAGGGGGGEDGDGDADAATDPVPVPAESRLRLLPQERPSVRHLTWPWVQAMSNIGWAVSQLTMVGSPRARRSFLSSQLRHLAPFYLPDMAVVAVEQLRREGCIPRYALDGAPPPDLDPTPESAGPRQGAASEAAPPPPGGHFRPIPVSRLPPEAVVVFVSHRWLGRGCPDDDQGTKLKQVLAIADHVAGLRGVALEAVFLWLDYSVVDQNNPMPGVQALPIYIACCEEFVYVAHEEYWQRAWCLTEQFMHWKLAVAEVKHVLRPGGLGLAQESARQRPPDPTYGKLAVEADRVALSTMTAILPYDGN